MPVDLLDLNNCDWLAPALYPSDTNYIGDATAERLVGLVERKLGDSHTAKRFKCDPDYLDRMRLIVRAGYPNAERLCSCAYAGDHGGFTTIRRCNVSNLCPFCSNIRHNGALLANIAAYAAAGETAMVTLSFHGNSGAGHTADDKTVKDLWAIATQALRIGIKRGLFTGALVSRELAVESLVPLKVMAHAHAVIVTPQLNLDDLKHALIHTLENLEKETPVFEHASVSPKVYTARHRDEGDMYRAIAYGLKPFGCSPGSKKPGLTELYCAACETSPRHVVNDSLRKLVHLYQSTTKRKHRASALGALSHAAKASLRVPKIKQRRPENLAQVRIAGLKARRTKMQEDIERTEEGL